MKLTCLRKCSYSNKCKLFELHKKENNLNNRAIVQDKKSIESNHKYGRRTKGLFVRGNFREKSVEIVLS